MPYDIILIVELRNRQKSNKCECAGIGRQARLRGVCFTTYGFKSRHSHHRKDLIPCVSSLFYYNLDSMTINKLRPSGKTYTIGDEIPVNGESYSYPDDFDIVVLRDKVAVKVRDRMVVGIGSLDEYGYSG